MDSKLNDWLVPIFQSFRFSLLFSFPLILVSLLFISNKADIEIENVWKMLRPGKMVKWPTFEEVKSITAINSRFVIYFVKHVTRLLIRKTNWKKKHVWYTCMDTWIVIILHKLVDKKWLLSIDWCWSEQSMDRIYD